MGWNIVFVSTFTCFRWVETTNKMSFPLFIWNYQRLTRMIQHGKASSYAELGFRAEGLALRRSCSLLRRVHSRGESVYFPSFRWVSCGFHGSCWKWIWIITDAEMISSYLIFKGWRNLRSMICVSQRPLYRPTCRELLTDWMAAWGLLMLKKKELSESQAEVKHISCQ